ncbi:hypothetical protein K470DRAFT_255095 [Piedraia hortae CBS 480.64]|uniref:NTF2-domain-containing protein n=1 Tax=Piedraia hortae CBS 480.64 TaxID=1314780 RepID=A0A6A7C8I9_9PEZI|nr:hypothetical protein K470DRAFT_255095 [Piedraia hortae CBS 480.64]
MATEGSAYPMPGVNGHSTHNTELEKQHSYSQSTAQKPQVSKNEVGWYFVEQFYTTLSRSPDRLYLFYSKQSQFVSGEEAEKVQVCVGQRAINDRIKELDLHDCKVRVTNVDCQGSGSNIVIQVIGEMSNRSLPHKKFTQTFVLAEQVNGYFVLNDIFRFLVDEEDEEPVEAGAASEPAVTQEAVREVPEEQPTTQAGGEQQDAPPAMQGAEHKTLTSSDDPSAIERDALEVDKRLEEKMTKVEEPAAVQANGTVEAESTAEDEDTQAAPQESTEVSTSKVDLEPEKPQDPSPSPVATPAQTEPQPAPAAPPKTWAMAAASNNRSAAQATSTHGPVSQQQPAKPASKVAMATTPAATQTPASTGPASTIAPSRDDAGSNVAQEEWVPVNNHTRQQSRQTNSQPHEASSQNRGYIKNVHEGIAFDELRNRLAQYGELQNFDISRTKNSAFVDWKSPEGYQKAREANPHQFGDTSLYVEERRVRTGQGTYASRGQYQNRGRGGMPARGGHQNRGYTRGRGRGRGGD